MAATPPETPLGQFKLIDTESVDAFECAVKPIFGEVHFDIGKHSTSFHGKANFYPLSQSGLYYGEYGTRVGIDIPHATFIAQGMTLSGAGSTVVDGKQHAFDAKGVPKPVINGSRVELSFDEEHRHLAFCMNPEAVMQKMGALTGKPADKPLQLSPETVMDEAAQARLNRLMAFIVAEVDDAAGPPPQALFKELEQTLMVAFLLGHQHNYSAALEGKHHAIAPWQVRCVEQYIEAHWDQPCTVESIAHAVEASVRSIQLSFQTHRGYTPTEFLRKTRLRHARSMLSHPQTGTTVTSVAYACCFGNLGHFSKAYFDEFQELPSRHAGASEGRCAGLTLPDLLGQHRHECQVHLLLGYQPIQDVRQQIGLTVERFGKSERMECTHHRHHLVPVFSQSFSDFVERDDGGVQSNNSPIVTFVPSPPFAPGDWFIDPVPISENQLMNLAAV